METAKLSKLQRWILTRAASNPDNGDIAAGRGADLITARVLNEFYKIPLAHREGLGRPGVRYGGWNFSPKRDGRSFAAARAATSKAFRRLEQRGLAVIIQGRSRWAGINLTDEGKATAENITANTVFIMNKGLAVSKTGDA